VPKTGFNIKHWKPRVHDCLFGQACLALIPFIALPHIVPEDVSHSPSHVHAFEFIVKILAGKRDERW